jgi:DNA topoisomerase IB
LRDGDFVPDLQARSCLAGHVGHKLAPWPGGQEISGADFTVKDFRTWHATVLAAVGLAVSTAVPDSGRKRAAARVTQEVAAYLGNTPAVARSAYIDPVVFARYQAGRTIARALDELGASADYGELATQGGAEAAVLRLLKDVSRGR